MLLSSQFAEMSVKTQPVLWSQLSGEHALFGESQLAWRVSASSAQRDEPLAQVLLAEALMNLQPWQHWSPDGTPAAHTKEIVALLEQALGNVVQNAIRYNEPGGHVAVVLDGDSGAFTLRVADDGPGIATADRDLDDLGPIVGHRGMHQPEAWQPLDAFFGGEHLSEDVFGDGRVAHHGARGAEASGYRC